MRSIRIISEGMGWNSRILDAETGNEIRGVTFANVQIDGSGMSKADLTVSLVEVNAVAQGRFLAAHPETGEFTEVRSITFADGTTVEF